MALAYVITATDIHNGTELSVGYATTQQERGVRRFLVETTGANAAEAISGTKSGAISAVYTSLGSDFHNEITDMPLLSSSATRLGPKRFIVDFLYGWQSLGNWGGSSISTVCDFRLGFDYMDFYTVGPLMTTGSFIGLPENMTGSVADSVTSPVTRWINLPFPNSGAALPAPGKQSFAMPTARIRVPYLSDTNPLSTGVLTAVGRTNSNAAIVFLTDLASQITFTQGQLRFDGLDIQGRSNSSAGQKFQGAFQFSARYSWATQYAYHDSGVSGKWKSAYTDMLPQANFVTVFGFPTT